MTEKSEKVINVSLSAAHTSVTLQGPKNKLFVYVKDKQMVGSTLNTNVLAGGNDTLGLSEPVESTASDSSKETSEAGPADTDAKDPDPNPPIGNKKKETPEEYRERRFKTAAPPGVYGNLPEEEERTEEETSLPEDELTSEPLEKPLKDPVMESLEPPAIMEKPKEPEVQPSTGLVPDDASVGSETSDARHSITDRKKKNKDIVAGDEKSTTEQEWNSEDDD